MKRMFLLLSACLALSCNAEEIACPNNNQPKATVTSLVPTKALDKDLDVTGTIERDDGVTIYNVLVGGIAATGTGLDFDTFTVKLPYDRLLELAATSDSDSGSAIATLEISALTNCDREVAKIGSIPVPVALKDGPKVTRVAFEVMYPADAGYLPADQSASAVLRLRANPEAAGVAATLSSSFGTLGGVGTDKTITLSGDGKNDATATFTFKSDHSTDITACARGVCAEAPLSVVSAPVLTPAGATLAPGGSIGVTVLSAGKVKSCQATPAVGLHVTSGDANLMLAPGGKDVNGQGNIDIAIAVDSPLVADATTTVSCVDVFGQLATGTFTAKH